MNSVYSKLVKLTQNDWPKWQSTMNYVMKCFNWPRSSWVKACKNLHRSPLSQSFYDYQNQKFFHLKHSWTQSLDIAVLVSWKSLLARSKPWNTFSKERENITYVCKIRKRKQSLKETWAWDEKKHGQMSTFLEHFYIMFKVSLFLHKLSYWISFPIACVKPSLIFQGFGLRHNKTISARAYDVRIFKREKPTWI